MQLNRLISWLFKEGVGGVWPTFDKYIILIFKICYLFAKLFYWLIFGKKRTGQSKTLIRMNNLNYSSPSLYLFKFLFILIRNLGYKNPLILKISVPKYGYKVYCPINATINEFKMLTSHEEQIIQHFRPVTGDVVVDVGAYIGRYSLIASKHVGLLGKVISIEANPNNFEMLIRNVRLNQITNIKCINCAVYSHESKIKLYLVGERDSRTYYGTLLSTRANEGREKCVEVNSYSLDQILETRGINQVNWIKIDVEGVEYEVLKGAAKTISRSNDLSLLIEIHNVTRDRTHYEPIVKFLNSYRFKIDFERNYEGGEKHIVASKRS
jgi:FkbM family methyltransferase